MFGPFPAPVSPEDDQVHPAAPAQTALAHCQSPCLTQPSESIRPLHLFQTLTTVDYPATTEQSTAETNEDIPWSSSGANGIGTRCMRAKSDGFCALIRPQPSGLCARRVSCSFPLGRMVVSLDSALPDGESVPVSDLAASCYTCSSCSMFL